MATRKIYSAVALTGGTTGSLDSINGSLLNDNDICITITSAGDRYWHYLDADSGLAESSPDIISPDANAGNKRWRLSGVGDITVHDHADADGGGTISYSDLTDTLPAATSGEINTGTETSKYISPDALAGSNLGKRVIILNVLPETVTLTTGDGKYWFPVPQELNGYNIVAAHASVYDKSDSGGPVLVQIYNYVLSQDVLTTRINIDDAEWHSYTAATQPVIDTSNDHLTTGDWLRIDVDDAGSGAAGLWIHITCQLP